MSNTANLYSVFSLPTVVEPKEIVEETAASKIVAKDFETARENLHKIIKTGQEAFEELAIIAAQSQDAEAYTGLSSLLNSLIQANRELLALSKKKQDFEKGEAVKPNLDQKPDGDIINNNVFVGSTTEFLDMIEQLRNGKQDE